VSARGISDLSFWWRAVPQRGSKQRKDESGLVQDCHEAEKKKSVSDSEISPRNHLPAVMWHREADGVPSNGLGRHCSAPISGGGTRLLRTAYPTARQGCGLQARTLFGGAKTYPLCRCAWHFDQEARKHGWINRMTKPGRHQLVVPRCKIVHRDHVCAAWPARQVSFQPVKEESCQGKGTLRTDLTGFLKWWAISGAKPPDRCPAHFFFFFFQIFRLFPRPSASV
jgi:hypothetical protein